MKPKKLTCAFCKKPVIWEKQGAIIEGKLALHSGTCRYKWEEQKKLKAITTTGFLDITPKQLMQIKEPWLATSRDRMIEDAGVPCDAFNPECASCTAWAAFLKLVEFFHD